MIYHHPGGIVDLAALRRASQSTYRWGDPVAHQFMSDKQAQEDGLRQMCDHGAQAVGRGDCDVVSFDVMPSEADYIIEYMARAHPLVSFLLIDAGDKSGAYGPPRPVDGDRA